MLGRMPSLVVLLSCFAMTLAASDSSNWSQAICVFDVLLLFLLRFVARLEGRAEARLAERAALRPGD